MSILFQVDNTKATPITGLPRLVFLSYQRSQSYKIHIIGPFSNITSGVHANLCNRTTTGPARGCSAACWIFLKPNHFQLWQRLWWVWKVTSVCLLPAWMVLPFSSVISQVGSWASCFCLFLKKPPETSYSNVTSSLGIHLFFWAGSGHCRR